MKKTKIDFQAFLFLIAAVGPALCIAAIGGSSICCIYALFILPIMLYWKKQSAFRLFVVYALILTLAIAIVFYFNTNLVVNMETEISMLIVYMISAVYIYLIFAYCSFCHGNILKNVKTEEDLISADRRHLYSFQLVSASVSILVTSVLGVRLYMLNPVNKTPLYCTIATLLITIIIYNLICSIINKEYIRLRMGFVADRAIKLLDTNSQQ